MDPTNTDQSLYNVPGQVQPQGNISSPTTPPYTNSPKRKRSPALIIFIVVFLVIVASTIAYLLMNRQNAGSSSQYLADKTIALYDVSDGKQKGTATRILGPYYYLLTGNFQLPPLTEGKVYQIWEVAGNEFTNVLPRKVVPVSAPNQEFGGLGYAFTVSYNYNPSDPFYKKYEDLRNNIVISIETNSTDDTIETKVLQGNFPK